ncbi:MAG: preprotein translocase subunit SecG [Treponema sp. GWB1_62_6]|nr:MAG: preprotein translocase subunit SecG [Treponema sp. GWA1_62_8]OHE65213.1 MAG: preprotein translocase subunit SecG [Treponema sp. GWB1_62_6]OHE67685.1 MAG: preprotein translocase subunit SecG [Treponema sp. GWC1_61_84]OHE76860.1 MAG: preprotein translocase subunit SecG [Treponema sp. RIFOXYC1_FULL_61_9]HCM29064.1 preprotein translocase subunit SecG [Treponema sp.]
MGLIGILLLVVFVLVSILLVLMVLVQNEDGDSLGGIFAGGSGSAFGSRSGNVLTKTTYVLGTLFLLSSFGLALINRTPGDTGVEAAAKKLEAGSSAEWWNQEAPASAPETAPVTEIPADAPAAPAN